MSSLSPSRSPSPSPSCSPGPFCFGFTTSYDLSSNKLFERHLHAESRSHLYPSQDSINRLLQYQRGVVASGGASVTTPITLPGADVQFTYNLDHEGNWNNPQHQPVGGGTVTESRSTNALNQVATRNGATLQYDPNGNLLQDSTRKYQYDALNRLIGVSRLDGCPVASYAYDAGNRRVRKTGMNCGISGDVPAVQLDYVYRGAQVVEERDSSNNPLRQYVWGRYIDELLQQRELSGRAGDYYPLADLHHRTVALTDSTGKVQEAYDTDAYGNTLVFDCGNCVWFTDGDRRSNRPLCRYVYTGREYDPETGMYYYRARYFDPDLGRFISRDPISYAGGG